MSGAIPRTLLVVLDGWGVADPGPGNAIAAARTPAYDALVTGCRPALLSASGEDVGLPAGVMGNSEVGHMNIGAGRIVEQDLMRITRAVGDGSLAKNSTLLGLLRRVRERRGRLHLMGLVSDGSVHSLDQHLFALLEIADREAVPEVLVHAFLDGRDTPPRSALDHIDRLEDRLRHIPRGRIASVCGRFFAMDRDQRWDRLERAWRTVVEGEGASVTTARAAIEASYAQDVGDEFVEPVRIRGRTETAPAAEPMRDGDGLLFFNFRADRARQLTRALVRDDFAGFPRRLRPRLDVVTMTRYEADSGVAALFGPIVLDGVFADVMTTAELDDLRVAETEKYAHVTYFFNGGREAPRAAESRCLVPSQRVRTYDRSPEMSASGVTDAIVHALEAGAPRVIIANYANADMVGHTGSFAATVRAVEVLDDCLARLVRAADAHGVAIFLTADHGNAEQMLDPVTGAVHTAHTTNPVPLVVRAPGLRAKLAAGGRLADVVPTILDYWGIGVPAEMSGASLLRP